MKLRNARFVGFVVILTLMAACSGKSIPTAIPASTPIPAGVVPDWEPIVGSINNIPVVYVPAGCFMMGSTDEEVDEVYAMCQATSLKYLGEDRCGRGLFEVEQPLHEVCLSSFWIGQTEVTNAEYAQCVEAGECSPPSVQEFFGDPDYADCPVAFVDWEQAREYAEWVGGDLPTEAQWAYTARGPMRWAYPWGNTFDGSRLNFCDVNCPEFPNEEWDDGYRDMSPVGSYPEGASWVGALDMAGNISERVYDYFGHYSSEREVDPTGPTYANARVGRGGSFRVGDWATRSAIRGGGPADVGYFDMGFRVAFPTSSTLDK